MRNLEVFPAAKRYLRKIKEKALLDVFLEEIDRIREDPSIGEVKRGDLADVYCRDVRYKGTNYELAYMVMEHEGETVVIILAGTRENFYDDLKNYLKEKKGTLYPFG